jgi:hypothetical protein
MTKIDALPRLAGATALSLFALALVALVPATGLAAPPEGSPLVVSPSPLVFEKTTVGNQAQGKDIDLYNEGEEIAPIDKVAIEGEDAAAFNLTTSSCGAVFPLQHCYFSLSFMPNSPGEKHAFAVITFKDGRPAQSLEISGTAVEPQLTFSPSSYDFGLQRVYDNRNTYLQVTNSGEATVQVNNFEVLGGSGSFWTGNSSCWGHSLQPGESCSVEVTFGPQDAVAYTAELRASANGYGFLAQLSGEGGRAVIEATPNPADFGTATVGAAGEVRTITLTNSGNIPAGFFIGIVAGGDSASFQLLSENCSGVELQPGAGCSAQVRFSPLSAGAKLARLAFFGDSDAGAQIMLTGEGAAAAVTLLPAAFDFGTQAAGSRSDSHSFAVRNDGSAAIELGAVSLVGADPDQFTLAGDECSGEALAPGAECLVRVRFAPDGAGAKKARLRVAGDAGDFLAALAGNGTEMGFGPHLAGPGANPADQHRPPHRWRHRRFVRGADVGVAKDQRRRRTAVRASAVPR